MIKRFSVTVELQLWERLGVFARRHGWSHDQAAAALLQHAVKLEERKHKRLQQKHSVDKK